MPTFDWTCKICESANDADFDSCVHCGAESKLTADEVTAGKAIYEKIGGRKFDCPKCGCQKYVYSEIRTAGGPISGLAEVSNRRFLCLSCKDCGFAEFYRLDGNLAYDIIDFLT